MSSLHNENSRYPPVLLFSIDLEDLALRGDQRPTADEKAAFTQLVRHVLAVLKASELPTTFFAVTDVVAEYPELVQQIAAEGHEIAWHSLSHLPLNRQTPDSFARDIEVTLRKWERLNLPQPRGFRAPFFSLTEETQWAYPVLARHGFLYSSSVLPAARQPFGWTAFGPLPRHTNGIWELPVSTASIGWTRIPIVGGAYFRALPWWSIRTWLQVARYRNAPLVAYLHPYDFDLDSVTFTDAHVHPFTQYLMNLRRGALPGRIRRLVDMGWSTNTYDSHTRNLVSPPSPQFVKDSNSREPKNAQPLPN